ncbi:MAG: hypothetical protein ACRDTX_02705 [Pseudonocardiaceae bacterium]
MTARKIADQLGQAQVSVTQDYYLGHKIASEDVARVLEIIGGSEKTALIAAGTSRETPVGAL